ncbi:hypothetical protein H6F67_25315 [Microcoleus sp. FACHB-1515]|uniref:hypothetical protein n=1 Tax=Cyanophyceae TaxID=3028117 RepID=UPI001689ADC0|nr:hypothetical protein [Microcoleus sp. FACHB-1515]MBD2093169.1 hypothetical protein [Microcoleus sp. FACHB-1515]
MTTNPPEGSDSLLQSVIAQTLQIQAQNAETLQRLVEQQRELHDMTIRELRELRRTAEEQARTARLQQDTINRFVSVVGEMGRAIADQTRNSNDIIESSRRAAQAAEAATVLAQNNQNAIRDLIEEMRRDR